MNGQNMNPPKTYAEWVKVLEMLEKKEDDKAVLEAMKQGTIEWQYGVAERFSKKVIGAVNARLNAATDYFQKQIGHARGEERIIVQALLGLRKELRFLADAITIPAIPKEQRDQYHKLVIKQADTIQQSLEDSAKRDRSGKLANIVRNNKVNAI